MVFEERCGTCRQAQDLAGRAQETICFQHGLHPEVAADDGDIGTTAARRKSGMFDRDLPGTPPVDVRVQGRSPGLRIIAFAQPSRDFPVAYRTNTHRSQLRGQLRLRGRYARFRIPIFALRPQRIEENPEHQIWYLNAELRQPLRHLRANMLGDDRDRPARLIHGKSSRRLTPRWRLLL